MVELGGCTVWRYLVFTFLRGLFFGASFTCLYDHWGVTSSDGGEGCVTFRTAGER